MEIGLQIVILGLISNLALVELHTKIIRIMQGTVRIIDFIVQSLKLHNQFFHNGGSKKSTQVEVGWSLELSLLNNWQLEKSSHPQGRRKWVAGVICPFRFWHEWEHNIFLQQTLDLIPQIFTPSYGPDPYKT